MTTRILLGCLILTLSARAWDRKKAFQFLEARQQEWAAWKPAQKPGGACVSCHTGLSYMLALRESGMPPAPSIASVVKGVKSRVLAKPPQTTLQDAGAEAVLNAATLALQRHEPAGALDDAEQAAVQALWEKQVRDGEVQGSWTWIDAGLHPFDSEQANYFGTALAALAISLYPPAEPKGVAEMRRYLARESSKQPLHNRLAWIAFVRQGDPGSGSVLGELWKAQARDGGWTTAALGPWPALEGAAPPPDRGSNAYATAWAAFAAWKAGTSCTEPRLSRALTWLDEHQDPVTGGWNSASMNKVYPEGSIQSGFMTDAASGYAAAVLSACKPR